MIDRRLLGETAALVGAAVVCAAVANLLASRERKLPIVGDYPNAQVAPVSRPSPPPAASPVASVPPDVTPEGARQTPSPATAAVAPPGPVTPGPGAKAALPTPTPRDRTPVPAAPRPPAPVSEADVLTRFSPHPERPSSEITGEDAAWLHARRALFLDARRTKDFEQGHVRGALPFSVWESDVGDKVFALVNEGRRPDLPIVVYCSGGECEDSHMLSEKLFGAGFTNVLVYRDGWPDWQRRGGAARTGPLP